MLWRTDIKTNLFSLDDNKGRIIGTLNYYLKGETLRLIRNLKTNDIPWKTNTGYTVNNYMYIYLPHNIYIYIPPINIGIGTNTCDYRSLGRFGIYIMYFLYQLLSTNLLKQLKSYLYFIWYIIESFTLQMNNSICDIFFSNL